MDEAAGLPDSDALANSPVVRAGVPIGEMFVQQPALPQRQLALSSANGVVDGDDFRNHERIIGHASLELRGNGVCWCTEQLRQQGLRRENTDVAAALALVERFGVQLVG